MQPDFVYTLTTPTGVQQRIPITLVEEHGSISVPDTFTPPDWAALRYLEAARGKHAGRRVLLADCRVRRLNNLSDHLLRGAHRHSGTQ